MAWAKALGLKDALSVLKRNLEEEKAADGNRTDPRPVLADSSRRHRRLAGVHAAANRLALRPFAAGRLDHLDGDARGDLQGVAR